MQFWHLLFSVGLHLFEIDRH